MPQRRERGNRAGARSVRWAVAVAPQAGPALNNTLLTVQRGGHSFRPSQAECAMSETPYVENHWSVTLWSLLFCLMMAFFVYAFG
jgi:hypothetical protein